MATEVAKMKKDQYNQEERVIVPAVDIFETENEFVLKADMPGVTREHLDITLDNNRLEINGAVPSEEGENSLKYREFRLHNYHRSFTVGENIDTQKIAAALENGVLTLTLPKSERAKPRKIEITVEK